jgi:hypothetical protein
MVLVLGACGGATPEPEAPKRPRPAPEAKPEGEVVIDRAALEVVLRQGPPWVLERVPIEPELEGEKFIGWRVRELPREWERVDLVPGDVITSVNGMPVETPDQLWEAWTTLTVASELRIAYVREGEAKELSIPIWGKPSAGLQKTLGARPEPTPATIGPSKPQPSKSRSTVVIESEDRPFSDTEVDYSE